MDDLINNTDKKPIILIVDDIAKNLQVLGSFLHEQNYEVSMAENGFTALSILENFTPDLILLDINMPEMNGYEVCEKIKANPKTREIPVIFLTALSDTKDLIRGFQTGGVDYITKPFNRDELLVRIRTHLELKYSRELLKQNARDLASLNSELIQSNMEKDKYLSIINQEISSAADYVRSLLPKPIDNNNIKAEWCFKPSEQLGGDSFGYSMIDDENMAIYMLDVSGHGIKPSLYSVTVLNYLTHRTIPDTDFADPVSVINGLNHTFCCNPSDDLYFTIWYGVYNLRSRELQYISSGHHPALLLDKDLNSQQLHASNLLIGVTDNYKFKKGSTVVSPGSTLYIFTDGVFEIKLQEGMLWNIENFLAFLVQDVHSKGQSMDYAYRKIVEMYGHRKLKDDFSLLRMDFK